MRKNALISIFMVGLVAAPAVVMADASVPEKAQLCASCHGPAGTKPILPDYPIIGGQYPDYLKRALEEYKSGVRKNAVMNAQAAQLSKEEIKQLSQYFGAQESPLYTPSVHDAGE